MDSYLEQLIGDRSPEIVTAVIEVPQDGISKYEHDSKFNIFVLDRFLHSPAHFPCDRGFIPQTTEQDGDPLDILVLGDTSAFPGCAYNTRPIRLLVMLGRGVCDENILAYATVNPRVREIQSCLQVQPHILMEIEYFFSVYKDIEEKQTKGIVWKDRSDAFDVIRSSHERFMHRTVAQ